MLSKLTPQQLTKYDCISFKIPSSPQTPQYNQTFFHKIFIDSQITPEHPLYSSIFPKKQQLKNTSHYLQPLSKFNQSLQSINTNINIQQSSLRNINGNHNKLSTNVAIQPHQKTDPHKIQQKLQHKQPQTQKPQKLTQPLKPPKHLKNLNNKYMVYYSAGPLGYLKGNLTLNNNYIIFNPFLQDKQNLSKLSIQKLQNYNVLVQMTDIQKVQTLPITSIHQFSQNQQYTFHNTIQFMLYKVGKQKIQKKYKQKFKQLKNNHQPIAFITFSFKSQKKQTSEYQSKQIIQIINNIVAKSNNTDDDDDQNKKRLTNIPYFDVINDKIMLSLKSIQSIQQNHILTKSIILGSLSQNSDIITPTHFQNLIKHFPLLYKLYNWQRAFSARKDGSSFTTFLRKSKNVDPCILLLKQYKGNILGAFLVQNIQPGKTGRGQMFIFTYRTNMIQPQIYQWTNKNDFFVYVDKDQGIGIGMGFKYGIFINKNFQKGFSSSTITFGNKYPLSVNEDFQIDQVQLWGVDGSF